MGARGPQPGFKRARAEAAAAARLALQKAARAALTPKPQLLLTGPPLTPAQLRNPVMLSGTALKELAYRMGMAKSLTATMSDEKIRLSLRYITADLAEREPA